jgi:type IV pilus assembly protein PilB
MPTPNDPITPKKPAPPPPAKAGTPPAGAKPGDKPAAPAAKPGDKPAVPPKPGDKGSTAIKTTGPGKPPPAKPTGKEGQAIKPAGAVGKPPAKPAPEGEKPGASAKRPPVPARGGGQRGTRKLGQVLIDLGFIDEDQLWEVLDEAKNSGQPTGQSAVARGLITEEQLLQAMADQHGLKVANLEEAKPQPEATQLVPETMASVYKILPLALKDKVLTIVLSDPSNMAAIDDLRNLLGIKEVIALLATAKAIAETTPKFYAGKEESIIDVINALENDETVGTRRAETSIDLESLMELQDAAPVRKLLNMVMLLAIKDHASDIHFEPFEDEYKMRYRCDGTLYEMVPPPRHLAMAISSRIKVMANLDIAERRLPQDGRIELNVGGNPVDMRVSVLPTMFGESVVIRVLDRSNTSLDLEKLGMEPTCLEEFRHLIHKPNGITLVTGPTGAGKTTTLYSALNELNVITDKIITTEDPVEYDIDGIIQCQVNPDIDLTFASALRSILRQDPDIILVGEIRDLETAQIAIQASLTGHMVFSTLHTNDAPSSVTRLRDMGVEPFLITATLEGILAQRLVRKICDDCRTEFEPSPEVLMELNLRTEDVRGKKFFYGRGCDRCNNTGHRGRAGIYELVLINDEVRDMISQGVSTDQLRSACKRMGMSTLRDAGLRAIYNGITTIEEVVRETVLEDET